MAAGSIIVDLLMRTGSFETDTARAEKRLKAFKKEVEEIARTVGLFAGTAAVGFAAFIKSQIDAVDKLNDIADATGSAIEKISGLEDVAARTGASIDTVATSLVKFNKELTTARDGNEAAQVFKALGLSVEELRRMDPADALLKTAIAFQQFERDGNLARATQVLFGKSIQEVAPFLKDLAEKGELVTKVTKEEAEQAEIFNKHLFDMKKNSQDTARAIAAELLPAMNDYLDKIKRIREVSGVQLFKQELVAEFQSIRLKALVADVEALTDQLSRATPGSSAHSTLARLLKETREEADRVARSVGAANEKLKDTLGVPKPAPGTVASFFATRSVDELGGKKSIGDIGGKSAAEKARSFTDYAESIKEALGKMVDDSSFVKIARINDELAQLDKMAELGLEPSIVSEVRAKLLAQLPAKVEDARTAFRRLEIASTDAGNSLQRFLDETVRSAREVEQLTAANDALRDEIAILVGGESARRAVEDARLSSAIAIKEETIAKRELAGATDEELDNLRKELALLQQRRQLTGIRDVTADLMKAAEEEQRFLRDLGESVAHGFEDAIVRGQSLRGVLQGIAEDVLRILARRYVSQPLSDLITQVVGGALGSGGVPNTDDRPNRGGRASGGAVLAGESYLVGERGPERFTPYTSGAIVPATAGRAWNGGAPAAPMRIEIVNNTGVPARGRTERRADGGVAVILDAVVDHLRGDMAVGGQFSRGLEGSFGVRRAPQLMR